MKNADLHDGVNPCPFCGGAAKVSLRCMRFIGRNGRGDKKIKCGAQVICNRCKARGPVYTAALINPYDRICQKSYAYQWLLSEAKNGWNRRTE